MAMTKNESESEPASLPLPNARKCCKVCNKFVYLHQPILMCDECGVIFHGKCLNFNNNLVFKLQRTNWYCSVCNNDQNCLKCHCCSTNIDVKTDKFEICKNCRLPSHSKSCLYGKNCLSCIPTYKPPSLLNSNAIENDINSNELQLDDQPYFNPFDLVSNNNLNLNGLIEPQDAYDNIAINSKLLQSCEYYNLNSLAESFESLDKDKTIAMLGLNIDGFKSNFDKFRVFDNQLKSAKINFSCYILYETNVTQHESEPFFISNYNKFVLDKIKLNNSDVYKRKGSGIAIFLDNRFNDACIEQSFCVSSPDLEILTVRFNKNNYIVGVYRPPSGNYTKFLESFDVTIDSIISKSRNAKVNIIGDFNANLYNPSSKNTNSYLDCVFSNGFYPLISRATHFMGINPTCIDHILTNDIENTIKSGIIQYNISHHMPIFSVYHGSYEVHGDKINSIKKRVCLNESTINGFSKDFLNKLSSEQCSPDICAKESFDGFLNNFNELYNKWFLHDNTIKCNNPHTKSEWITIGLAKSCNVKNRLYFLWRKSKSVRDWNNYQDYKRTLDKLLRKAKYDFYDKKFSDCKSDLKKTWRNINQILGRKRRNHLLTFNDPDASHNFNKYFTSIAHNLLCKNYSDSNINNSPHRKYLSPNQHVLEESPFEIKDLEQFIKNLNNNKSTYFSPKVLKGVSSIVCPVLIKIFNKCYTEGYFPEELKVAKVIPLYKNKGEITDISNYRPISMLSVFSKLFEKLMHKKLSQYLECNDIVNSSQYGFRASHSTLHALINATDNVYKSLDNKLHTLGIFIDFSKAFDTVNHDILLDKLHHYGIRGKMFDLLHSYLSNRSQYVYYGNTQSSTLQIDFGVPQGSVLGPLLFIIFINDIINVSNFVKFVLFADDANLFISHTDRYTLYSISNDVLRSIFDYCSINRIIINYEKCCFIEFNRATSTDELSLSISNYKISRVSKCKFLGVIINENLNWTDQLIAVKKTVSQAIGTLYSAKSALPQKLLRSLYFALVQPYFVYTLPLWGARQTSSEFNDLFKLQKKAIRIITNQTAKIEGKFQNTKPLFKKSNILTIHNLYFYLSTTETKIFLTMRKPVQIFELFDQSARSNRLILPKFNYERYKSNSFIFNVSKIVNNIISNGIDIYAMSQITLKINLKRYLITKQSATVHGDLNWYPCNLSIFSDINF